MKHSGTIFGASMLAFAVAASPAPAWGQDAAATPTVDSQDNGLGDIVVTARRTQERSQTVPISITAFTQETLRDKSISDGTDLQNFTPSLSVVGHVSRNDETYTIRGMGGGQGAGTGSGPGVVAYFAEVPSTASGPGNFYDLQSLQVLKGPQGTLFGRNTTGGAVLLEPRRPDFNGVSGYAQGIIGSYSRHEGEAAINLPIVDDVLAIRVAGRFQKQDGQVHDVNTGEDYLNRNNWSARLGIQFNPASNIQSYTAINYVKIDEHGGGNVLLAVRPGSTYAPLLTPYLVAQQARDPYHIALSTPTKDVGRQLLILNNTSWNPSSTFTIKNVFSFQRIQSNTASDGDASPLTISDLLGAAPGSYNVNTRRITEEFQLRYDDGRFSLQGGGFYLNEKTLDPLTFRTINPMLTGIVSGSPIVLPTPPYLLPLLWVQPAAEVHGDSKAVYAQARYKLTPALTATAGFRWTWDTFGGHIEQYLSPDSFTILPGLLGPAGAAAQALGSNLCVYDALLGQYKYYPDCTYYGFSGKSNGPTWQVGLDWQANPDTLLYAVSRRGYKSGGFNPIVMLASPLGNKDPLFNVRPERVTDAEIGLKRDWTIGGMKARTNVAAFYTWYDDIQVNQRQVFSGSDVVTNAKSAVVKGVEFEGMLKPFSALTLSATYSYNDAHYTDYHTLPLPAFNGNPAVPSMDVSDTPFIYVPKHKYTLDARLDLPVAKQIGDVALAANWTWQSAMNVAVDAQPFSIVPSYGLLNLRLEINNIEGRPIDFAVFGTNVLDQEHIVAANMGYNTSGYSSAIYGDRAEVGASLRYRF